MSLIDKEQFINEMNTRAEEEALDFRDIRDMVEFAPTVKAVPLDKVKKACEEIRKLDDINPDYPMDRTIHVSRNEVLAIIDKLIAERRK